jgi:two-component system NarL family sensor kinase
LMGVDHDSLIGIPLQRFINSDDQVLFQRMSCETLVGPREAEMSLRRADGTKIPANVSFRLLTRDKSSIGVLITDLTGQKRQAELTANIQRMQDDERRRIARELHDSVGQLLAAISMNIAKITDESNKLSPGIAKLISDNASLVNQITDEIRNISHLLHPPLLDEVGLPAAIRWYADGFARRSNIPTTLDIPQQFQRLSPEMEIAIFRVVQECLTNIHRHSGSPSCSIKIEQHPDRLRVEIRDLGRGIPESKQLTLASSGGIGLRGMQERIRQLRGSLQIETSPKGTVIAATLPVLGDINGSMSKRKEVA